ncbi:hypothetical protein Moror_8704 [Moniliophthora roreri MCA 2997]|uniref:CFEM domain-containing protein n=2 Tax=Moniliophthora roreri TaxID=221103 RepID=V2X9U1_MONRO|nr:hypothetical protein Moror_8704 [Moniliophthora roreri MCA 2997]KAI3602236.1 hypothetical protein WG66_002481 [Moniliophthora roreri]
MKSSSSIFSLLLVVLVNAQDPTSTGNMSPCFYPCDLQASRAAACSSSQDFTCICQSQVYQETLRTCLEGCPQDREAMLGRQAQECGAAGIPITNTGSASASASATGSGSSPGPASSTPTSLSASTGPGLLSTSPTQTSGGSSGGSGSGTSEGAAASTTSNGAAACYKGQWWTAMAAGTFAVFMINS